MRKLYFIAITFLFLLFFVSPEVEAQAQCDVLHYKDGTGWTCSNLDKYNCERVGGTFEACVTGSYSYTQGSCCEPPDSKDIVVACASNEYCTVVPEGTCGVSGGMNYGGTGVKRNCQEDIPDGSEGCCIPNPVKKETYDCEGLGDYRCTELFDDPDNLCSGFPGPFPCGPDGLDGCCVPNDLPDTKVKCPDGYGCKEVCPPGGRCADTTTNCGPNNAPWYCVYGELDDGQTKCVDPYGCRTPDECTVSGIDRGDQYYESCGDLGAKGCCVKNAPDEEVIGEDPEIPDEYEEDNRPSIFKELFAKFWQPEDKIAAQIYNFVMPIGAAIGIFSIIIAGYSFMTSQGNPEKVKGAKDRLTAAIAGTMFIVLSLVILKVIINTLF